MIALQPKTVYFLDYVDLENAAKEAYGCRDYSFVATEECGNDSSHTFFVAPIDYHDKVDTFDAKNSDEIRRGVVPLYGSHTLLRLLCTDGFLPSGHYVVRVSW